jgi:hypothetical protein
VPSGNGTTAFFTLAVSAPLTTITLPLKKPAKDRFVARLIEFGRFAVERRAHRRLARHASADCSDWLQLPPTRLGRRRSA